MGWDWDGMGLGWDGRKSLKGVILRAPLCGANKHEIRIDLNYLHEEIFCLMKHEMAEICQYFKQFRKVIKMARSFLLLAV